MLICCHYTNLLTSVYLGLKFGWDMGNNLVENLVKIQASLAELKTIIKMDHSTRGSARVKSTCRLSKRFIAIDI